MTIDATLRGELLAMEAEDARIREDLVTDGSLWEGYHPRMAAVHRRNAARLNEIVDRYGWSGRSLAGEDGARAAWRIAQHAIGSPALQRRCLPLLEEAAQRGDMPAAFAAMLGDRIRFNEGRPQRYGCIFDWDEHGQMTTGLLEDAEHVEQMRREAGLPPLDEDMRHMQEALAAENAKPPPDYAARRAEMAAWARSVGWR